MGLRGGGSVRDVRRRHDWSSGAVTVDAWRERDGEETSVERRPMPLRAPHGAHGTSTSVLGP
jgi:transposase-like protein